MKLPIYADLSHGQKEAVDLDLNRSCIVTGPPGSGKTVVAIHRTNEANLKNRPNSYLMYNRVLESYVNDAADTPEAGIDLANTEKRTFHSWFGKLYSTTFGGRWAPQIEKFVYDWPRIIPEVEQLVQTQKDGSYGDLFIDEGQDLPKEFYKFVDLLGMTISIYADEYQRITSTSTTLKEIQVNSGIDYVIYLETNFRNPQAIADLAAHIAKFTGTPSDNEINVANLEKDLPGQKPLIMANSNIDSSVDLMLRSASQRRQEDVGVLTSNLSLQDRVLNKLNEKIIQQEEYSDIDIQSYSYRRRDSIINWGKPGIKLIQFASAKGVEFDTVFIPELQSLSGSMGNPDDPATARIFYMAITRARRELILSYDGSGKPEIMKLLPDEYLRQPRASRR